MKEEGLYMAKIERIINKDFDQLLSTIENGKRNIPPEMEELVIRAYDLSEHDKEKLRKTIIETTAQLKVDLTEMEEKKKKVIFSLTKGNIDEETLNQLCEIIDKSRGTKK